MAAELIDLDAEQTWPRELLSLLDEHFELIAADLHANGQLSHYKPEIRHLARECDWAVRGANLLGFHCSRLLDAQIEAIERDGLLPLQPHDVARFVESHDLIPPHLVWRMKAALAQEELGWGRTWFFLTRGELSSEDEAFYFTQWGGELFALQRDPELDQVLRRIGRPCVIEAVLPWSEVRTDDRALTDKVIEAFASRRIGLERLQFEVYVSEPVQIRNVHRCTDPEFAKLTKYEDGVTVSA